MSAKLNPSVGAEHFSQQKRTKCFDHVREISMQCSFREINNESKPTLLARVLTTTVQCAFYNP